MTSEASGTSRIATIVNRLMSPKSVLKEVAERLGRNLAEPVQAVLRNVGVVSGVPSKP